MSGFLRRLPSSIFFPEPPLPDGRLSYLFDVLTPRDTWMHRLELVRATGGEWQHRPHDADIVAQVVRDLGQGWSAPAVRLTLTGAGGGTWTLGTGTPTEDVTADTLDAMLHLSGRDGLDLSPVIPVQTGASHRLTAWKSESVSPRFRSTRWSSAGAG